MKKSFFTGLFFSTFCFVILSVPKEGFAQQKIVPNFAIKSEWTTNPFHQSALIENVGQFDDKDGLKNSEILFGFQNDGVEIYFTRTGFTYKHNEYVVPVELESKAKGRKEEEDERKIPCIPHYVHVEFENSNTAQMETVVKHDAVKQYYTYGDNRDKTGKTSLKAFAYKKITLVNLYPGIDIEYTIPENKSGFKYALILHPGADPSLIQMHYSGEEVHTALGKDGNVIIKTSFGDIIDHAPISFYQNISSLKVNSAFQFKKNNISFDLPSYDHSKTIVIDPWSSVPTFTGYNGAYDCDFDNAGNMYVYGGTFPWQVIKFNNAGAQQWVYSSTPFSNTWGYYYGDFCVDHASGSSYQVESINTGIGTQVIKLNNAGTQIVVFPGNVNLEEGWRIAYDQCTHKIVIAGGGVSYYNQGGTIDTNCTAITYVNVISFNEIGHDMCYLTLDKSGFAYMATTNYGNPAYNNLMMKFNEITLAPNVFQVFDGYTFQEGGNLTYISGGANQASGYNGICCSPNFLYTCDGVTLKKWNKTTGVMISSAVIAGTPRTCGGMDVDDCDNIYIGVQNAVNKYDVNLALQGSTPTTNIVYDLRLGLNNKLYVSGKNFAQELSIVSNCTITPLNITASATGSSCSSNSGSATVVVTGGNGPYTYSWVPGGQTTSTITGLSSGTYTCYITDNSCPPVTQQATVTVTNSGSLAVVATQSNAQCSNSTNGSATVVVSGGQSPYTYSWAPSGGTNSTATGLGPGTYTVFVTDASGCSSQQVFTITAPPPLTLTIAPTNILCNPGTGSALATAGGGSGPYTYSWNNSTTNANATGLAGGTYTCYITDANGCTFQQTVTIIQPAPITATITSTNPACGNSTGTATANASGGTGTLTYSWAPSGGNTANATGLGAGTYTIYVTDANGCTQTATVTLTNSNAPTVSIQAQINITCGNLQNGSVTVNATGGTSPYTYAWSPSGGTSATASGLAGGTYTCTITDANGCTVTQVVTITSPPPILLNVSVVPASCGNNDGQATATASGGTGTLTYNWTPSGGTNSLASGLAVGTYTVTITDANGCTTTQTAVIVNGNGPTAAVSPDITITGGNSTVINATGGGTYSWSPTWGLSCGSCPNPTASPTQTTTYCCTVTDQNGCTDIACMTVYVDVPCPSNSDFSAPNAFSPNGDGVNDFFTLEGWKSCLVDFDVRIYDRWGEKVYESRDILQGWDGTYKGKVLDPAVFVFYISAKLVSSGQEIVKKGNVSLIR